MRPSRPVRRLAVLVGPAVFAAIAFAFVLLLVAIDGPVRLVTVKGDLSEDERSEVRAAVVAALEGSYFTMDLDAVVDGVLRLSWPHDVRVRRTFPAGVAVDVAKEVFVARWGGGGALNSEGEVIAARDVDESVLPLLDCALADGGRAMKVYQTLAGVLSSRDLRIATLRENAIGEWTVAFDRGLEVALGAEDMLGRLERFLAVYDGALADRIGEVAGADARYSNGIAVTWREPARASSDAVLQLAALDRTAAH